MKGFRAFGIRSEGTMLPRYYSCEVYSDGRVELESGYLLNPSDTKRFSKTLSAEALDEIRIIINDNRRILSLNKLEVDGPVITDGSYETLVFSDGYKESILTIDSLWYRMNPEHRKYYEESGESDLLLVMDVYEKIRKVLIKNGIKEEYC